MQPSDRVPPAPWWREPSEAGVTRHLPSSRRLTKDSAADACAEELTSFSAGFAALFDAALGSDGADGVGFSALLGESGRRLCFPVVELTSFSAGLATLFDAELGFDGADEVGFSALPGANGRLFLLSSCWLRPRCHEYVWQLCVKTWLGLKRGSNQ